MDIQGPRPHPGSDLLGPCLGGGFSKPPRESQLNRDQVPPPPAPAGLVLQLPVPHLLSGPPGAWVVPAQTWLGQDPMGHHHKPSCTRFQEGGRTRCTCTSRLPAPPNPPRTTSDKHAARAEVSQKLRVRGLPPSCTGASRPASPPDPTSPRGHLMIGASVSSVFGSTRTLTAKSGASPDPLSPHR